MSNDRSIFTDAEFALLAREMKARTGIALTRELSASIETRLMSLQRRENLATIGELIAHARSDGRYWTNIVEALLVHETRFFRDRALFALLRAEILPALMETRRRPLRVLCAGCSTGQEAYSISLILEGLRDSGFAGGEVLGLDYSERLLEKARAGAYTQFEVQRGLPIRVLITNFEKTGDLWRIADRLRALTQFERHNLLDDPTPLGRFDLIVCQNVLGALDPESRLVALEHLSRTLREDGLLMTDDAEASASYFHPHGQHEGFYLRGPDRESARVAAA